MKTRQPSTKRSAPYATPRRAALLFALILAGTLFTPARIVAQQIDPSVFSGLRWREIGPFRGGRAVAATGVPGQPNHFYFGSVGGGVWESFNSGETWTPIFDKEPVGSIGAIAVAPSAPNVIYVGSGEADMRSQISFGNGMYKSSDAGKTWTHIGLEDTRQIGRVLVDPRNPDVVFVAALGHAYGPNAERGVFRSTDGGKSWQKVLFKDENTGAIDLAFDPKDSQTIYAALWATRRPPWSVYPPSYEPGGGLYKSSDGGSTWQPLTNGLPSEGIGRIGVAVAPANPQRVYAIVDAKKGGLYRSDDAGASWHLMADDRRIWGRGWYFSNVVVDPREADTLYVSNTSVYRSTDGGKTFVAIKGAPGGDDYHQLWIYPDDGDRMVLSSDQGTVVSVDGAKTWSSWYNQPTAQIYHVVADNRYPYWVYGAQQDSGAVGVASRGRYGAITFRDWVPVCAGGESGNIAVDPEDANTLFGDSVSRCDLERDHGQSIAPTLGFANLGPFRHTWTLPLVASATGPHAFYFSNQYVWKTVNGGASWQRISDDLTRENPGVPANLDPVTAVDGSAGGPRHGVVYALAPSPLATGTIWAGTDDGLIHVTLDGGKTWKNVTPPELTPWSKVALIDASHFDAAAAYAAVDRHRLEDYKPYIYRTRDGGKTWQAIANGIPDGSYVNAVREDIAVRGLLFAGTELGVYVSFDDGEHWQPLQLNLPVTSARDFAVHGDDLIVATHGRGFWILDDITPLRQVTPDTASRSLILFRPQTAIRTRPNGFDGTPLPYDTPVAQNAPTGAILNYYLKSDASGPVTLEILDSAGKSVRKYSSEDKAPQMNPNMLPIPTYWIHPPAALATSAGMHRWVWDLRYASTDAGGGGFAALFGFGGGLWAAPGRYTVKLAADRWSATSPLVVKMDPRVKVPLADLQRQFAISQEIAAKQAEVRRAKEEVKRLRNQIQSLRAKVANNGSLVSALDALDKKAEEIGGASSAGGFDFTGESGPSTDFSSLGFVEGQLDEVLRSVQGADAAPTESELQAFAGVQKTMATALAKWAALKDKDLASVNAQLQQANLPLINLKIAEAPGGSEPK